MSDLKNKNIIVTGASSGLGRAAAIKLSYEGARVCLVGRSEAKLKETYSLMKERIYSIEEYHHHHHRHICKLTVTLKSHL